MIGKTALQHHDNAQTAAVDKTDPLQVQHDAVIAQLDQVIELPGEVLRRVRGQAGVEHFDNQHIPLGPMHDLHSMSVSSA